MIKKFIVVNPDVEVEETDENEATVIEAAWEQRLRLKEMYEKEGLNINPLCLIQIPDNKVGREKDQKLHHVLELLEILGETEESGTVAIHLSDTKTLSQKEIIKFDSSVNFLIFKQALALGWDCNRAHVMVKLRESQSESFTVQVFGRIMRMPEQKYYKNEHLNVAYVYTTVANCDVKSEKINANIILNAKIPAGDSIDLALPNWYKTRLKRVRLTQQDFSKYLKEADIDPRKFVIDITKPETTIIKDGVMTAGNFLEAQRLGETSIEETHRDTLVCRVSDNEIQDNLDSFLHTQIKGFWPSSSLIPIRRSLQERIGLLLDIDITKGKGIVQVQNIILYNKDYISEILMPLLVKYREDFEAEHNQDLVKPVDELWTPNREMMINTIAKPLREEFNLSLHMPCHVKFDSSDEERFAKFLESKNDIMKRVEWWYKNGTSSAQYLGIPYGDQQITYPDFVVLFIDESVGIFEVKGSQTKNSTANLQDTVDKARGIQEYISMLKEKGRKIIGGIVTEHQGTWKININQNYRGPEESTKDWQSFTEFILGKASVKPKSLLDKLFKK